MVINEKRRYAEVAAILGITVFAVHMGILRIRNKIRAALDE